MVIVENNVATYTCRNGFRLYYKGTYHDQISRICTKTTEWEGIIEPTCQSKTNLHIKNMSQLS